MPKNSQAVDYQPPAKMQKLDDEPKCQSKEVPDLPTEMFEKILGFVSKEEVKKLSLICMTFNELLKRRIVLRLNFDRITADKYYPEITRRYQEIKFTGDAIEKQRKLQDLLESSEESAMKLQFETRSINERTLAFVLNFLPNVEDVHIDTYLCSGRAVKERELPSLERLKHLKMSSDALPVVKRAQNLTKLDVSWHFIADHDNDMLQFISAQKKLEELTIHGDIRLLKNALPNLKTLNSYAFPIREFNYFDYAPNLQHLHLGRYSDELMKSSSKQLKTISIDFSVPTHFSIELLLRRYSSLQTFKSRNLTWQKS